MTETRTSKGKIVAVSGFFNELKRRNVLRAAVLYAGATWALAQGFAQLAPVVGAPDWTVRWFLVAAVVGFPFWIAFAWFYEFTPGGLKRESEIDPADSIAQHDLATISNLLPDSLLFPYHHDPRFAALCRQLGLPVPGETPPAATSVAKD